MKKVFFYVYCKANIIMCVCSGSSNIVRIFTGRNRTFYGSEWHFFPLYSRGWQLEFRVKGFSLIWAFGYLVLIFQVRGWGRHYVNESPYKDSTNMCVCVGSQATLIFPNSHRTVKCQQQQTGAIILQQGLMMQQSNVKSLLFLWYLTHPPPHTHIEI